MGGCFGRGPIIPSIAGYNTPLILSVLGTCVIFPRLAWVRSVRK